MPVLSEPLLAVKLREGVQEGEATPVVTGSCGLPAPLPPALWMRALGAVGSPQPTALSAALFAPERVGDLRPPDSSRAPCELDPASSLACLPNPQPLPCAPVSQALPHPAF